MGLRSELYVTTGWRWPDRVGACRTSRCVNPEYRQRGPHPGRLAVAALTVLIAAGGDAHARGGRSERPIESIQSRSAGEPTMAIVSLRSQRITVYDAPGGPPSRGPRW